MTMTIAEMLEKMPAAFQPEKAPGLEAVIQFKFSGAEAGEYFATFKDDKCSVTKGTFDHPKMTVSADSADLVKILTGEMDGVQAFMQGKIKIAGDLNLAMKMVNMFKLS